MQSFIELFNGDLGSSVRGKLNRCLSSIISGSEGINAIWNALRNLHVEMQALDGGVGGLIMSTSYDPSDLDQYKSATLIALGQGTFTNFKDSSGRPITISQGNSFTIFFRGAGETYWRYTTTVIAATTDTKALADISDLSDLPAVGLAKDGQLVNVATNTDAVYDKERGGTLTQSLRKLFSTIKGDIQYSQIDTYFAQTGYYVVLNGPSTSPCLGLLEVFHDSMNHMAYQRLTINCEDPNVSYLDHMDSKAPRIWERRYNISSAVIAPAKGTWSRWEAHENFTTERLTLLEHLSEEITTLGQKIDGDATKEDKTFVIPSNGTTMSVTNKQTINLKGGTHYSVSCSEVLSSGYLYFYDELSSATEVERVSISAILSNGYNPPKDINAITIYNTSATTSHNVVFEFTSEGSEKGLSIEVKELAQKQEELAQSVTKTSDIVDSIIDTGGGYNLFNPSDDNVWNGYIKSNGGCSESTPYDGTATYFTTGFIKVKGGKTYYNAPLNGDYYGSRFLMYYDADKLPIVSSYNSTDRTASSVAPANAKYLRISVATRYFDNCQITEGQQRDYESYVEPSSDTKINGAMLKNKSVGKNALADDIDLGGRSKMFINLSDTQEEIFLKLRQAIEQKDTDVYWEKGTYTFDSIFDLMATKYAPMQSYELPVGGNCRYFFNGAILRGIYPVGSDFDSASRNLMGSARVASDYELHDGFLYAEGLRYVFHDETNGSPEQYRRLYHNMHFSRKWAKPDVSSALEKIIGGGTGEWGIVEFDGCTFKADSRAKQFVTYHGVTKNTTEYSRFECVIKNCYIDGVLNFYDAAGYSTSQHWHLVICNNAINTIGRSSINDKFDIVEFGNETIQ